MILDTSAVIAIVMKEPGHEDLEHLRGIGDDGDDLHSHASGDLLTSASSVPIDG